MKLMSLDRRLRRDMQGQHVPRQKPGGCWPLFTTGRVVRYSSLESPRRRLERTELSRERGRNPADNGVEACSGLIRACSRRIRHSRSLGFRMRKARPLSTSRNTASSRDQCNRRRSGGRRNRCPPGRKRSLAPRGFLSEGFMFFSQLRFGFTGMANEPAGFAECLPYGLAPEQPPTRLAFANVAFDACLFFDSQGDAQSSHKAVTFAKDGTRSWS